MKEKIIIYALVIIAIVTLYNQAKQIANLKDEREKYRANTETLAKCVEQYKTKDLLNAAQVGALTLTIEEYERYRANDLELIKTLQIKNRDLQNVTTTQAITIAKLDGTVRDSIIYKDRYTTDTLRCIDIDDEWYELHGCANKDGKFDGTFINRDSLLIAVSIKYKRFLGFLWKTSKVKDRKIDVVSRNPHTKIQGVEYVIIQ